MSQPHSQALAGGDAAELAQFGYTQSMERRTGRFASFAVAFAFVSIATGIFTTYGFALGTDLLQIADGRIGEFGEARGGFGIPLGLQGVAEFRDAAAEDVAVARLARRHEPQGAGEILVSRTIRTWRSQDGSRHRQHAKPSTRRRHRLRPMLQ